MPDPISRRELLVTGASALAASLLASNCSRTTTRLGIPGPYRGLVVAVEHPGSIVSGRFQAEPIREMMRTGLKQLTGADHWTEAWKVFFEPGDVVGLKLNPVGRPHVVSCAEVIHEIVEGLKAAGVKTKDIVAYDRYRKQFFDAGFDKMLPAGVRHSAAVEDFDTNQQKIAGYDPDHYMEMPLVLPGQELNNVDARRSYVAKFLTREVNKLINLPVLKDHQSAGVTLALKNLSHGLVNNVYRSHPTRTLNVCGAFIPAVVGLPIVCEKTVLHILDGIRALYHGGPGAEKEFVWEQKTMYFATDPVALDRVGWKVIDAQRTRVGMRPVAEAEPDKHAIFISRQPEHIELAGAMGLGEWNDKKIELKSYRLS